MTPLPGSFLHAPIAHRGLQNRLKGRVENSLSAIRDAMDAGYGIEIDLQVSADGVAMVFHDDALDRLTHDTGPVRDRLAEDLVDIGLKGGHDTIPRLADVLDLVAGRAPLLLEIKDQDGGLGADVGALEVAVADDLRDYEGPVAVMSFNPHSIMHMSRLAPDVPRGLVTDPFAAALWPGVSDERRDELREIPDFDACRASFISHNVNDLKAAPVARLKAAGVPVLCWTVRSPEVEAKAREVADNITFEGYLPAAPSA